MSSLPRHQWIERCSAFFARRSLLVLFTLLLLSGLTLGLVPVAYVYFLKQTGGQTVASSPAGRGFSPGGGMRCNQVSVRFASAATMQSIARLMDRLDASIVYGPDQDGAFELAVVVAKAEAIVHDLDASDLVVTARLLPSCP